MKTLRTKPVYKLYFRYKNITLWKNKTIDALTKKKWMLLKASKSSTLQYNRGIYLYHFKKLNLLLSFLLFPFFSPLLFCFIKYFLSLL